MANFAGFDTGSYPGDNVMTKWYGNPYVFTGFYLEAPCHSKPKFKPWMGHSQFLKQIGWGLVVVYVGRQATGCGSTKLTREQGLADATDAIAQATAEGFANGVRIFLDVELMDPISAKMLRYVRGWLAGILQNGRHKAGIYAHFRNAAELKQEADEEFADQGVAGSPAFWIVRVPGGGKFNVLTSSPSDLKDFPLRPISFASVWQGKIDIASETHNGVIFGPVDQNVADSRNPSGV